MIETAVWAGCGRAEMEEKASCGFEATVMVGEEGLIGVAGRL
jgi:hypothetical protein